MRLPWQRLIKISATACRLGECERTLARARDSTRGVFFCCCLVLSNDCLLERIACSLTSMALHTVRVFHNIIFLILWNFMAWLLPFSSVMSSCECWSSLYEPIDDEFISNYEWLSWWWCEMHQQYRLIRKCISFLFSSTTHIGYMHLFNVHAFYHFHVNHSQAKKLNHYSNKSQLNVN